MDKAPVEPDYIGRGRVVERTPRIVGKLGCRHAGSGDALTKGDYQRVDQRTFENLGNFGL